MPEIADWCAVDLIDEIRRPPAGRGRPPGSRRSSRWRSRSAATSRRISIPTAGIGRVMHTGVAELYPIDHRRDARRGGAASDEHLELLRTLGMRSVLLAPAARPRPLVRGHDPGDGRVAAALRRQRPRVRPADRGARGRGRGQRQARHRPAGDRADAPAQPASRGRARDRGVGGRRPLPVGRRRGRDRGRRRLLRLPLHRRRLDRGHRRRHRQGHRCGGDDLARPPWRALPQPLRAQPEPDPRRAERGPARTAGVVAVHRAVPAARGRSRGRLLGGAPAAADRPRRRARA